MLDVDGERAVGNEATPDLLGMDCPACGGDTRIDDDMEPHLSVCTECGLSFIVKPIGEWMWVR